MRCLTLILFALLGGLVVQAVPAPNANLYVGCFVDQATRDLNGKFFQGGVITSNFCRTYCAGFTYFAMQDGAQCLCGNYVGAYGQAPNTDCSQPCQGNTGEICGAAWRNSVYKVQNTKPALANPVNYIGCYQDQATRDLNGEFTGSVTSGAACRSICRGFTYFGLQDGSQCFCGNRLGLYGQASWKDCSMQCQGNADEICGGYWRNSVFLVKPTPAPNANRYVGCYKDTAARDLNGKFFQGGVITSNFCGTYCKGFKYFGMQDGNQCLCGDNVGAYGQALETDCQQRCVGNEIEICGGAWRNSVFYVGQALPTNDDEEYHP
jgi:hypothetical protein